MAKESDAVEYALLAVRTFKSPEAFEKFLTTPTKLLQGKTPREVSIEGDISLALKALQEYVRDQHERWIL